MKDAIVNLLVRVNETQFPLTLAMRDGECVPYVREVAGVRIEIHLGEVLDFIEAAIASGLARACPKCHSIVFKGTIESGYAHECKVS